MKTRFTIAPLHLPTFILSIILSFSFPFSSLFVHACGKFEFYDWNDLPNNIQTFAEKLGYDASKWDHPGYNPIEYIRYENLTYKDVITPYGVFKPLKNDGVNALAQLDLVSKNMVDGSSGDLGTCWDFVVNHYRGYTWDELQNTTNPLGDNVGEAAILLGWNQTMWDAELGEDGTGVIVGQIPEYECSFWFELLPEEKWALMTLGWTRAEWADSPCDPRCPDTLACSGELPYFEWLP